MKPKAKISGIPQLTIFKLETSFWYSKGTPSKMDGRRDSLKKSRTAPTDRSAAPECGHPRESLGEQPYTWYPSRLKMRVKIPPPD